MSYEMAVWEGEPPGDNDAAQATFDTLYEQYLEENPQPLSPRLRAFAEALDACFPGTDSEDTPWSAGGAVENGSGPITYFAIPSVEVDKVAPVVTRLAEEHGLVFFDPQQIEPSTGVLSITSSEGTVGLPERWLPFLSTVLRAPDGYVIVDSGRRNLYAQARNDGGVLTLEYRDGSPHRHYQVQGVDLGDVAEALSQWADGRREFVGHHTWKRLERWGR